LEIEEYGGYSVAELLFEFVVAADTFFAFMKQGCNTSSVDCRIALKC